MLLLIEIVRPNWPSALFRHFYHHISVLEQYASVDGFSGHFFPPISTDLNDISCIVSLYFVPQMRRKECMTKKDLLFSIIKGKKTALSTLFYERVRQIKAQELLMVE